MLQIMRPIILVDGRWQRVPLGVWSVDLHAETATEELPIPLLDQNPSVHIVSWEIVICRSKDQVVFDARFLRYRQEQRTSGRMLFIANDVLH